MATLIRPINFSSTSIPTSPLSLKKAHRTPLLKVPQKPTSLEEAVLSLTDKLAVTKAYKSLDEAYSSVLDHCTHRKSLSLGKQIHTHIIKRYSADDLVFLNTKLVLMYGKCGSLLDAEKLFDEMYERSIFTYNAMLGAYISNGEPRKAIELYADMRFFDILPDAYTCSCVLKACAGVEDICSGREIHGYLIKFGLVCNEIIVNSLVSMYARCNNINAAEFLFARSGRRDVVLWNLMISAYVTTGMRKEALRVFDEMQNAAVILSTYTFVAALQACEELLSGMQIHALCSRIDDATRVFEDMGDRDNVSWNSMLAAYVQNNLYDESLGFFREITRAGQLLDQASIISALSACGRSGNLWNGLEIHAFALKNGMELDLQVSNTIIDMYAKCSKTSFMGSAFQRIPQKDHVSWTTIITGYVQNFCYVKALQSFREVLVQGIEIDKMMIESVLLASRGLKCISLAKEIHGYIVRRELSDMSCYDLEPWPEHYACLVDLLGRANCLEEAFELVKSMKLEPTAAVWCALLGACRTHSNLEIGETLQESFLKWTHITQEIMCLYLTYMLQQGDGKMWSK
ncbi:UNVERIFIED_CONTAM: Pentatricopeptide repeat-containing protein, chloroplastic [Sesamum radiatum]|uniref:Pentatricopeptide repeat-containing protein, chloroplastic n=1 Tax=Sesamum radiatum TaxID=300843 RepID=A0AAW2USF4_SESRA